MDAEGFADLLAANRRYSISAPPNFDRIAHAGVLTGFDVGADPNQLGRLHADVEMLRTQPLIAGRAQLGGFLYNVDSCLLEQHV